MVRKRLTLFERIRRLNRIIRYLHRRGTLFRSKPTDKIVPVTPPASRKKKVWRPWRKIRYLARKGSLFRRKPRAVIPDLPPSYSSLYRKKKSRFSPYLAYRRIRFLYNTGRLFSSKKDHLPVKKRKRRTLRKIRYLLYRRSLLKLETRSFKSFWRNYFRTLLRPEYLKIIINSTVIFLLAYLLVFALQNFTSSISALTFEIKSIIYYYNIEYLVRSRDWTTDAIKVVFSSGPFFCFLLALIVIIVYINLSQETWFIRLLFFWIFCHAFIHFFGEMLIGTIFMKGFGLSIVYMFMVEYKKLLIILGSSFFMILSGLVLTKMAIFSGNTYFNMITKSNRSYFLHSQFLIPYFAGFTILILVKSPEVTEFDILVNLTMLFIILPMILRGRSMKDMYFDPETRKIRIRWIFLLLTAALLFLFRVFFGFGIRLS